MFTKLLFALSAVAVATAAPTAHVFLIIGQSNSVSSNGDGHTSEDVSYDNIVQTSCCNNGQTNNDVCQLVVAQDPLHHACDTGYLNGPSVGFGMTFARELRATIPAEDIIVLVPAGIGGTGFNDDVWTAYTGRGFTQALKRLQNTFPQIAQKYPSHTASFDGILWHQGENDADTDAWNVYLNNHLIPMVMAWRDTKLIPQTGEKVAFVVGNLVPQWVNDPNDTKRINIAVALQLVSQYIPYAGVAPSIGLLGNQPFDYIHFTAPSQRAFGKRYFTAYKSALLNGAL